MKICLKSHARQKSSETVSLHLTERLPERLGLPCAVTCEFRVEACSDYYLLTTNVRGILRVTCQRCVEDFQHEYAHQSTLAVCANDLVANDMMSSYDCMVAVDHQINLVDVITDELNLFLPEKHLEQEECAFLPIQLSS